MRLPVTEISTRVRTTGSGLLRAAALLIVATAGACTVIGGQEPLPQPAIPPVPEESGQHRH
jgi:hypothetical protein